ncbi:MAG TPA: glycoside hydrolase family 2 TIM barrel-domain containing protein [Candidatus Dormibacteraeota bacterium]|nr:glycoside hydrolase family 2 TIM barrel-domain containing protein [Candidatus Dormibacteraeota bacterium]
MNDCISLPLRQGSGGLRALGQWECVWQSLGEGEAEGLATGRGRRWEPVPVPFQQAAVAGRSVIWYRTSFPRPDHDGRVVLRIGGAFLATHVWLNGRMLGSHYGYFAPFGFDVTSHLRDNNLLVICCESPIETDLSRKRHVMGVFSDGDSRPYPGAVWFSLPEPYRWEVPVGLWRPVELEYLGPVSLDWVRLRPNLDAGDAGRLDVEVRLRNLDGREMIGDLQVEVTGMDLRPLRISRRFQLPGGSEQTNQMTLSVPHARRWNPWRSGEAVLYRCATTIIIGGRQSVHTEDQFGFRDVAVEAGHDGWHVSVNGQPMFLRGANYTPNLRMDQLTEGTFETDLRLARESNLDALRVHGHVLPDEFYKKADEAGMLVIADFPLTLSYAYHASAEESRFFETVVRNQVPEMVELLRNRPSLLMWIAHDDPPWVAANAALADVHAVRQNYTIDHEIKAIIEELDPTRTALAASGDLDHHLWLGWCEGSWSGFADALPGFVSEFGAQAAPSLGSPAWEGLSTEWPLRSDDPRWLYAGFQLPAWAERGAGVPEDHASLEDFVHGGQEYQAQLLGYAIDQLRKRKFEPCWGALVYQLVDPFPGVGFGLADSARVPKAALEVVQEAFAPVRVIIDPVGFTPLQPCGAGWRPGEPVTIRLIVVNDDPRLSGPAEVRWAVWRERPLERGGLGWLRDAVRRKSYSGSASFSLPTSAEPALQLTNLTLPLDAEGDYVLEAELRIQGNQPIRSAFGFRVAEGLTTTRPRYVLPDYLAERIVLRDSLRPDSEGVRFKLRNLTRPAVLTRIADVRLDERQVDGRVLVQTESGRLPLPRRLDLPVGREIELLVETPGAQLEPGEHQLELDLTLPGVASGRVRVLGNVPASSR